MPGRRRRTPRPVPATTEEAEAKIKEASANTPSTSVGYTANLPRFQVHTSISLSLGDFNINMSSHREG